MPRDYSNFVVAPAMMRPDRASLGAAYLGEVDLIVSDVLPGEPIQIRWQVNVGLLNPDCAAVHVRILIDGLQVFQRRDVPVNDVTGTTGDQHDTIVVNDPAVARLVYRIGRKKVIIRSTQAETNKLGPGASVFVRVVPEPIDASWWTWRSPAFESVAWKDGYSLVGDFGNRSEYASMVVEAELSEVRSESDSHIDPCAYDPEVIEVRHGVAPGGRTGIVYNRRHDWQWFLPGAWIVVGVLNRTFDYAVYFRCTDEYGNLYEGRCSPKRTRHIGVAKYKRLAAAAAQSAAISALAVVWLPPLAAGFLWAAAVWGVIALDPPEPDPDFDEEVLITPVSLPGLAELDSLPATVELLKAAVDLAALENARTVCRSRLLGASEAGAEAAWQRLWDRYRDIERSMIEASVKLSDLLVQAQDEVEREPHLDPKYFGHQAQTLITTGLPEETYQALVTAGVSLVDIQQLNSLVRDRDSVELACISGMLLAPFVTALQQFVVEIEADHQRVHEGETYVHVPDRDELPADYAVPDEARLRSGRCC